MDLTLIVAGCRKSDARAQRMLFEHFAKGMLLLCKRYVKDGEDAEEMLLNGFHKFFSSIRQFEYVSDEKLAAWLKKIMVNECLMFLRKQKTIVYPEDEFSFTVAVSVDVLQDMNAKAVYSLINSMPDGYRIVFNLFAVEGYLHKEIAGMLGIAEGTSKSQYMRAKVFLQKLLEKNGLVNETR